MLSAFGRVPDVLVDDVVVAAGSGSIKALLLSVSRIATNATDPDVSTEGDEVTAAGDVEGHSPSLRLFRRLGGKIVA